MANQLFTLRTTLRLIKMMIAKIKGSKMVNRIASAGGTTESRYESQLSLPIR